jgi:hypothetical protein
VPVRNRPTSPYTNDPSQRFLQQTPTRRALDVCSLGQVGQFAPYGRQIGRMWKSNQVKIRPLAFNGS